VENCAGQQALCSEATGKPLYDWIWSELASAHPRRSGRCALVFRGHHSDPRLRPARAKWNAFGFIVTIALGSAMATGILSARVSILQSTLAFALLLGLQLMFATIYTRWPHLRGIFNPPPELIFRHGKFIASRMKRHRIAEQDVRAAVRSRGIDRIEDVDAVVLEPNGSLSVLKSVHPGASALLDVTDDGRSS
jgi:hypothetical protein